MSCAHIQCDNTIFKRECDRGDIYPYPLKKIDLFHSVQQRQFIQIKCLVHFLRKPRANQTSVVIFISIHLPVVHDQSVFQSHTRAMCPNRQNEPFYARNPMNKEISHSETLKLWNKLLHYAKALTITYQMHCPRCGKCPSHTING